MTTEARGPLARVEQAHRLLAQARTVDEVKDVRDQAAAAALYAKERGYSQEIIDYASEIKVRAERKAGEILTEMPKNAGARGNPSGQGVPFRDGSAQTLAEMGVSPKQSMQWQQIAAVPEPVFEEAVREVKAEGRGITTAAIMRTAETKVQRDVMDTVREMVPGAEERMARAQLKAIFSKAVADVRRNLLALDPEAVYSVLQPGDLLSLRSVMTDLEDWISRMRAADARPMRAIR